jgi:hypothetical protein
MVEHELSRGAANAAANLLHCIAEPPAELAARVAAAVEDKKRDTARLAKLEHDIDIAFGARTRHAATFLLAAIWLVGCVAAGVLGRGGTYQVTHLQFGLFNAAIFAVVVVIAVAGRKHLLQAANRQLVKVVATVFAGFAVLWPTLGWAGVDLPSSTVIHAWVGTLLWSAAALQIDRAWAPMPIGQAVIFVGAMLWPTYHFEILGIVSTISACCTAIARRASR